MLFSTLLALSRTNTNTCHIDKVHEQPFGISVAIKDASIGGGNGDVRPLTPT